MRVSLVLAFLFPVFAFANSSERLIRATICDAEASASDSILSRESRVYLGLVRLGSRLQDIEPEDLKWLQGQSQARNPVRDGRTIFTSALSRSIDRVSALVPANEWGELKLALAKLSQSVDATAELVEESRQMTASIFKFRQSEMDFVEPRGNAIGTFVSRQGEIFYQSFDAASAYVTELYSKNSWKLEDPPAAPMHTNFFEAADGELYYAWTGRKGVHIINLRTGHPVFEKAFADSPFLKEVSGFGTPLSPIIFESNQALKIAVVTPPGFDSLGIKRGYVVFDREGNELRMSDQSSKRFHFARLDDGKVYEFGLVKPSRRGEQGNIWINEIGEGAMGIHARVDLLMDPDDFQPMLFLRDGQPQLAFVQGANSNSILLYNQMRSKLVELPGVGGSNVWQTRFFTSLDGKASFASWDISKMATAKLIRIGEVGNPQSLRSVELRSTFQLNTFLAPDRILQMSGRQFYFVWQRAGQFLVGIHVIDVSTGDDLYLPIPRSIGNLTDFSNVVYNVKDRTIKVFLKAQHRSEWKLFEIYGKGL